jgi:hypothetical protein
MGIVVNTNKNTSIYQLTELMDDLFSSHPNVETVLFGDMYNLDTSKQSVYPLVQVNITNSQIFDKNVSHNVKVWYVDRKVFTTNTTNGAVQNYAPGFPGPDNLIDVWNTGFNVMIDVVSYIKKRKELYDITFTNLTPFERRFDNALAGYEMDMTVSIFNDTNACIVSE